MLSRGSSDCISFAGVLDCSTSAAGREGGREGSHTLVTCKFRLKTRVLAHQCVLSPKTLQQFACQEKKRNNVP